MEAAAATVFSTVAARLRTRLAMPLPGHRAHLSMAPSHRLDTALLSVKGKKCREAAVLVLLYPCSEQAMLVLTTRLSSLRDHAGQVAFPGGRRETGETFTETALREAYEEIALDEGGVEVVGALTPLYIPPSRFCVYPIVALCAAPPALRPLEAEVEKVLHVPLSHLLDPRSRAQGRWLVRGEASNVPYYDVEGLPVWGATAMMLAELLALVQEG